MADTQRKLTDKKELAYTKSLTKQYTEAYKASKDEIASFIAKYSADGKLSNEFYKNGRYERLVKGIINNVSEIKQATPQAVNSYLKDQYMLNYYYTGFTLETTSQAKLGFKALTRKSLDPISITSKISLQQNREIVKSNIRKAVTQSIAQGEGIGDTSKRVKMALERNMNDAMRIARTETTTISGEATQRAMDKASDKISIKKQWVATLDGRTRDRHQHMDGEIVDIDEPFSNGLMYPGDQSGSAEDVINCRCTMITIVDDSQPTERRARQEDGTSEVIPYTTYEEWAKNRL